jgi:hypothetical protein
MPQKIIIIIIVIDMHAKDIVRNKVSLDNLPEPYIVVVDTALFENLNKAINILANKKDYKVVSSGGDRHSGYVIMEKKKKHMLPRN